MSETVDYIVIGSGSAGGVVAARLAEGGKYSVLCLEAGTKGPGYPWSRPPIAVGKMYENPAVNWCYHSVPDETIGSRSLYVPRGKMLGGTSSINGMIFSRGSRVDYDGWAARGCAGWGYDDVLPFFKKLESADLGEDRYRGRNGPMKVSECEKVAPLYDLLIQACNRSGLPYNPDYNGARLEGVVMAQHNVRRGVRLSTATQYLVPASRRPGLKILTGAEATRLIVEDRRCVGVRIVRDGVEQEVRARREVIVSCGALNTPKLLELSGIGDPRILGEHGIPVVQALEGVGRNLHDHYGALMKWRLNRPNIAISRLGRGWRLLREVLRYVILRKGFIAQGFATLRIFARSRPELTEPDLLLAVAPYMIDLIPGVGRRMSPVEGFALYAHPLRTESAGTVHISSADPMAPPAIRFRFLETETDRQVAVSAVRWAREIVASEPLGPFVAEELQPGLKVQTDTEILDYLRTQGLITNHMTGSCRMGNDPLAVVDERLRVRGIHGLRIADASVMPTQPSGGTAIPTVMIGEKCADMVLADAAAAA